MRITKAVITAAGRNQRNLPLQTLIDRDGESKSALSIVIEELLTVGVSDICVVIQPGDQDAFASAAGLHARRLHFVEQAQPRGYGDAVLRAKAFVGDQAFLHVVGDHLHLSAVESKSCVQQMVEVADAEDCAVSAVQATRETLLPNYGAVGGRRLPGHERLYLIERVLEKPTPTEAEQTLIVPGLRAGYYLCFFGIHVLTPAVMDILQEHVNRSTDARIELSPALQELTHRERVLAYEVAGSRYDIGVKYGLLTAQLALALSGKDRADVLAQLVELLATRN
jgi:UTP--glucose-1-phosphate uridylyltransferase